MFPSLAEPQAVCAQAAGTGLSWGWGLWTSGARLASLGLSVCVQLFKGKFFVCQGEDTRNITNKSDCAEASYRWVRHKYNFDNLGQVSSRHRGRVGGGKCQVQC